MRQNKGVPPSGSGLRPDGLSQSPLSQAEPLVPNAWPEVEWEEGYPTAEDDDFAAWKDLPFSFSEAAKFVLRELPKAAEHCCASCVVKDGVDFMGDQIKRIEFSTGGWSGAESLLGFISSRFDTRYFMESWRRGGHYVFEVELCHLAQGIEASGRDGETRLDPKDESPVGNADAPKDSNGGG